jgi:uncharacterized membrane protein YqiK
MAADAEFVIQNAKHCHGFLGASSMERLPTEIAIARTAREFKDIRTTTQKVNPMSAPLYRNIISWIILIVIAIAVLFWILRILYRRSTKETSFVRTGMFGEKVVIDGGALVWPMVHNITPVNMSTLQLSVSRTNEHALITKDRMRVDVEADFYVRVAKTKTAVSSAATTLGPNHATGKSLDLLSGRFVSSLREVAAEMSMEEIHEHRSDYVARVKTAALDALAENGSGIRIRSDHRI